MVKKVVTWGGLAFILFFIAFQPVSATDMAKSIWDGIVDIAEGLGEFFGRLIV